MFARCAGAATNGLATAVWRPRQRRRNDDVAIAAELKPGGAGAIETHSRNPIHLREADGAAAPADDYAA